MTDRLSDDQLDQLVTLRELAEQFGRARFAPAYEFTGEDLATLLAENEQLQAQRDELIETVRAIARRTQDGELLDACNKAQGTTEEWA